MAVRTWADSGADEVMTMVSLVTLTARIGDQFDAGTVPRIYAWRAKLKLTTAAVQGQSVQFYMAKARDGDNTVIDGGWATVSDAAITAANVVSGFLNNLDHIGNLIMDDDNGTPPVFRGSGIFYLYERFFSPVVFNATIKQFSATAADMAFEIENLIDI